MIFLNNLFISNFILSCVDSYSNLSNYQYFKLYSLIYSRFIWFCYFGIKYYIGNILKKNISELRKNNRYWNHSCLTRSFKDQGIEASENNNISSGGKIIFHFLI
jgi:hypothetical protein